MAVTSEIRKILNAHYMVNIGLSVAFFICKMVDPICHFVFTTNTHCTIDRREHEILAFLGVIIFWKNRKAINWLHYLGNVFFFAQLASAGLFFRVDPLIGLLYGIVCLVFVVLFPEPAYTGPERVTYFRGENLQEELQSKKGVWLIEFYANWSADCRRIAPLFGRLSEMYSLPNFRFGKLDVGRHEKQAEQFGIKSNRQLPTVVLFKDGQECVRKNPFNSPFIFSQDNLIKHFGLARLYEECKSNLNKSEKRQLEKDKIL